MMKQRIKNIFNNCKKNVDIIVIKNSTAPFIDDNFFYFTGLEQGMFEGSCAILHLDGSLDILVSELEAESARKSSANIFIYKTKKEYLELLKQIVSSGKIIGINAGGLSYQEYKSLAELIPQGIFVDVSEGFFKTRLIKDEQEVKHIKKACEIADDTMATISDMLSQEMSERELAAEINYSLQNLGAEKPAFDTISSFGKNTAEPHYGHGDVKLHKGDFILCDFGACIKRYNSDITRTFVYGMATDQQKEIYKTVIEAQQIAFDIIKPGAIACDIHNAVKSYIDSTKFKGRFIHSTGHSLGLAVHDGPGFAPDNRMELQENMIITVEPGIYLPGFGGVRIEDDILIKKNEIEFLTKSSRVFIELK